MTAVHRSLRTAASAAALFLAMTGGALAEGPFAASVADFKGSVSFSAGSTAVPLVPGAEVTASGSGFAAGQSVVLQRSTAVLASGTADADGKVTLTFTVPADAMPGQHPVIVIGQSPSATAIASLKVSPDLPLSGAEKFVVASAPAAQGLYQAVYSARSGAVFVASAVGRPPVTVSELLKFDPETLEITARATPPEAPARPDGSTGGLLAVYGLDVDEANGTVWVTNTRQNTIAIYSQDDLSLVKQFAPGEVNHARDVVIDETRGRAYVGASRSNAIEIFDTSSLEKVATVSIDSAVAGNSFAVMSLDLDPATGLLYTVSETAPEAAVVNVDTGAVEKVFALPGALRASGVAVDPDTNRLFVASQNSDNVLVIDLATDSVIRDIPVGAGALNIEREPVSGLFLVSNRGARTITVLDADGNVVANLDGGNLPNHASADGTGTVWAVNKSLSDTDEAGDRLWRIRPAN